MFNSILDIKNLYKKKHISSLNENTCQVFKLFTKLYHETKSIDELYGIYRNYNNHYLNYILYKLIFYIGKKTNIKILISKLKNLISSIYFRWLYKVNTLKFTRKSNKISLLSIEVKSVSSYGH